MEQNLVQSLKLVLNMKDFKLEMLLNSYIIVQPTGIHLIKKMYFQYARHGFCSKGRYQISHHPCRKEKIMDDDDDNLVCSLIFFQYIKETK